MRAFFALEPFSCTPGASRMLRLSNPELNLAQIFESPLAKVQKATSFNRRRKRPVLAIPCKVQIMVWLRDVEAKDEDIVEATRSRRAYL